MSDKLDKLNKAFIFKSDFAFWDSWRILDINKSTVRGDCDDYALSVLYYDVCNEIKVLMEDLIEIGRAKFWFVKTANSKWYSWHIVLEVEHKGFIDNWSKAWETREYMENEFGHRFKFVMPVWLVNLQRRMGKVG